MHKKPDNESYRAFFSFDFVIIYCCLCLPGTEMHRAFLCLKGNNMPNSDEISSRTKPQRFMDIAITALISAALSSVTTIQVMENKIENLTNSVNELKDSIQLIQRDFYTPRFNNNSPQSKQIWQQKTDTTSQ